MPSQDLKTTKIRRVARRLVIGALCGLVGVVVARTFLFDIRRIPSGSMLPTLRGDERSGDRVIVDRVSTKMREPRRFEILAFHDPREGSRDLVKRVVGLPSETVLLRDGDVLINGRILQKTPAERRALRIPLFRSDLKPLANGFLFDRAAVLVAHGAKEYMIPEYIKSTKFECRIIPSDGFELPDGAFQHHPGELPVSDLMLELVLECKQSTGAIEARFFSEGDEFLFHISPTGDGNATNMTLRRSHEVPAPGRPGTSTSVEDILYEGPGPAMRVREMQTIVFINVDCVLSVEVDGNEFTHKNGLPYRHETRRPYLAVGRAATRPRSGVEFSLPGGAVLHRADLYRDVQYEPRGSHGCQHEYRLGRQQYFVLGDYSSDSVDSRIFGAVESGSILGIVRAIVSPWDRSRWF